MRRLNLPIKKHKGINIYCSKCCKYFSRTKKVKHPTDSSKDLPEPKCGDTGKNFKSCSNFDKHKYKVRAHIPGTHNGVTSKTIDSRSYNDAVVQAIEFQDQSEKEFNTEASNHLSDVNRVFLIDATLDYLNFLANVDVPQHQVVQRSDNYIKEVKANMILFKEALKNNNVNYRLLLINKVEDVHVGMFHTYLIEEKRYSNKSYNNKMGALRGFFKWAIKKYKLKTHNVFEDVKGRSTSREIKTITKKEFNDLLNSITPENGILYLGGKAREKKNMYKPYLKDGIELCLHTGGRREEVVQLRWNMIYEIDGVPTYIAMKNLKVERMLGDGFNDNVAPKIIPITKGLMNILRRLGYQEHKDSDNYIIYPERGGVSNKYIMESLSRGFTHYYKQLGTERDLQLKCLRKTYLTYLDAAMGGDTKSLSSHTTDELLHKHYIDKKIIHKSVREVAIFS